MDDPNILDGTSLPPPDPRDSGVTGEQGPATTSGLSVPAALDRGGIVEGELVEGIEAIAPGFRSPLLGTLLQHFARSHQRLILELRSEVSRLSEEHKKEREQRIRLEERLKQVAAQDLLKLAGGAAIGVGIQYGIEGKVLLAVGCVVLGIVLAYVVGDAKPPWVGRQ